MRVLPYLKNNKGKYITLYKDLIKKIKKKYNIKVYHRYMATSEGTYDEDKKIITISSERAGTKIGLIILYHELRHYLDCIYKRHRKFYFGKPDIKLVWRVEWDCCRAGIIKLNKLGIRTNNIKICNRRWVKKYLLPVWSEYYINK